MDSVPSPIQIQAQIYVNYSSCILKRSHVFFGKKLWMERGRRPKPKQQPVNYFIETITKLLLLSQHFEFQSHGGNGALTCCCSWYFEQPVAHLLYFTFSKVNEIMQVSTGTCKELVLWFTGCFLCNYTIFLFGVSLCLWFWLCTRYLHDNSRSNWILGNLGYRDGKCETPFRPLISKLGGCLLERKLSLLARDNKHINVICL